MDPTLIDSPLFRVLRRVRTLLQPFVLALAWATAAGFAMEVFRPGSTVHVHWLGATSFDAFVAAAFCLTTLARRPLASRWGRPARVLKVGVAAMAALLATRSAWTVHQAVAAGLVQADDSFPSACTWAAGLLGAWAVVGAFDPVPRPSLRSRAILAASTAVAGALLVLIWIGSVGSVDHGPRAADAIVVFGSKVRADGTPSGSLHDRTITACRLWKQGAAPVIVLSGGRGPDSPVSEPESMRALALSEGVPQEALILDEHGVTTAATVDDVKSLGKFRGWRRWIAVSHDYHLARIRLLADRAGMHVLTVPARETCSSGWKLAATAREVAAFVAAWLL